ncbi:unnamed protein product [Enterobius vermicularis]|uniref:RNA-binding protein squid n=1 Tax=Enterobius vermicularis TaxID=51028 RepID=A0A0N4V227_ENTVE|nr:unnamed protein product [Enterobius vermicularis]
MDSQQDSHQESQNQNGITTNGGEDISNSNVSTGKGNEDKKIFVGGIAYDVTNDDLSSHFSQFGEVAQAQVKYDRNTGRSRGFAFVEFTTGEACKAALSVRDQTLKNKQIEVKPAKSRENKKVFVGGLPAEHPVHIVLGRHSGTLIGSVAEAELRAYFESFGKVEDIEWPYDKQTKARRNFAFIVFEEEEAADRASANPKQSFGGRECDVKKAVPQGKRFPGGRGGAAMRGGFGAGRGGVMNGWFGQAGWQMGAMGPYGGAAGSGAWGDWYGNAAANYYQQSVGGGSYAGYGTGYDPYSQTTTNQRGGNQQRYAQQQQF